MGNQRRSSPQGYCTRGTNPFSSFLHRQEPKTLRAEVPAFAGTTDILKSNAIALGRTPTIIPPYSSPSRSR